MAYEPRTENQCVVLQGGEPYNSGVCASVSNIQKMSE